MALLYRYGPLGVAHTARQCAKLLLCGRVPYSYTLRAARWQLSRIQSAPRGVQSRARERSRRTRRRPVRRRVGSVCCVRSAHRKGMASVRHHQSEEHRVQQIRVRARHY